MEGNAAMRVYSDRKSGQLSSTRRHDLDWLRVTAFLLLILYHIGMFYVPWGWHVKSAHAPVTALELPMKLMNTWRLPLLFFISGVALRYALDKVHHLPLLRRRFYLLFVPLLFGMYIVCAPQAWHELVQKGVWEGSIWEFYRSYIDWPWSSPEGWPIITPTWNHLWYLLYVLVYSVVLIVISLATSRKADQLIERIGYLPGLILIVPIAHVCLMFVLFDSVGASQTLWGDWYNLTASFLIMALGFAIAKVPEFWTRIANLRWVTLGVMLLLGGIVVLIHFDAKMFQWSRPFQLAASIFYGWALIWALLGWGQSLLSRQTPLLDYLSAAVFTYYMLHQTIIIMVGAPLTALHWPLWIESGTLLLSTAIGCWAGYHFLARRIGRFGVLLGARN